MCGRFTLYSPLQLLYDRFYIDHADFMFESQYNIAPSQQVLAVVNDGEKNRMGYLKWGLIPRWAKDEKIGNKLINARAETIHEKPSFKTAYKKRRCLIPADGFYEWKKEGGQKLPMYVRLKEQAPFAFAGLWERWTSHDGRQLTTCTIITTEPNDLMQPIHNRMPVILDADGEKAWLDKDTEQDELHTLLRPYPAPLIEAYEVSSLVNSPQNNYPQLIETLA
ncbi:SOS response-associated peptidase [Caldalkalibacillus salinus]|uniref:SOS response-associated peptidase n=1 Tax=Caldalkalibacillus salinus TaxID=2803787 RepID=UPI001923F07E|nr:SOS response-associated peptidase [Caldalkalibacillus salinus]